MTVLRESEMDAEGRPLPADVDHIAPLVAKFEAKLRELEREYGDACRFELHSVPRPASPWLAVQGFTVIVSEPE